MNKLNTYVVTSLTNYGTAVHIVNAMNTDSARRIARRHGAWPDCSVQRISTRRRGLVHEVPAVW